jgi:hypothetical protein
VRGVSGASDLTEELTYAFALDGRRYTISITDDLGDAPRRGTVKFFASDNLVLSVGTREIIQHGGVRRTWETVGKLVPGEWIADLIRMEAALSNRRAAFASDRFLSVPQGSKVGFES